MKPYLIMAGLIVVVIGLVLSIKAGPLWLINATSPAHTAVASLMHKTTGFSSWLTDVRRLSTERDSLAAERNRLQAQVAQLEAQQRQTQAVDRQLGAGHIAAEHLLAARTAGLVNSGATSHLLIDKGSSNGVQAGQIVVSDGVLVGRVKSVDLHVATIQLPQSQGGVIPVVIRYPDTLAKGVVEGNFNLTANLNQVLPTEKLESGAVILTSGEGGTYPPDLVVGKVGSLTTQPRQPFQSATVTLPWDLNKLETVFVVM